jgi:prepilin peptidase CpaA
MDLVHSITLVVAIAACVCDLRTRRIPNVLTFGAAAAGLIFHGATGGVVAVGQSVLGWSVGALVFIVPFALRGLGGGDVKLLAALGAWLGPADALWIALYTGVAGGVMAIVVSIVHGYLHTALANVRLLVCHWRVAGLSAVDALTLDGSSAPKLAYAVPILTGLVATLWLR